VHRRTVDVDSGSTSHADCSTFAASGTQGGRPSKLQVKEPRTIRALLKTAEHFIGINWRNSESRRSTRLRTSKRSREHPRTNDRGSIAPLCFWPICSGRRLAQLAGTVSAALPLSSRGVHLSRACYPRTLNLVGRAGRFIHQDRTTGFDQAERHVCVTHSDLSLF
jgi:hypothetical protein